MRTGRRSVHSQRADLVDCTKSAEAPTQMPCWGGWTPQLKMLMRSTKIPGTRKLLKAIVYRRFTSLTWLATVVRPNEQGLAESGTQLSLPLPGTGKEIPLPCKAIVSSSQLMARAAPVSAPWLKSHSSADVKKHAGIPPRGTRPMCSSQSTGCNRR